MNKCAWFHITIGIDVAIPTSARDTAAYCVSVIPKVHGKQRLGLPVFMDFFIHEFPLRSCGDEFGHRVCSDWHVGKEPCELCAHIDHGVKIFFASNDLYVGAGIAAGDPKQQLTCLEAFHCLDNFGVRSFSPAGIGSLFKAFDTDGRNKVSDTKHLVGKSVVNQRSVGKGQKTAVRMFFAQPDQVSLSDQRFAAGVNINIGPQSFSLLNDIVQLLEA